MIPTINNRSTYMPKEWGEKQISEIMNYLYIDIPQETLKEVIRLLMPTLSESQVETVIHSRIATNTKRGV